MPENIGKIGWIDMTVDDATGLRDFYDPNGATSALYQP